VWTREELERLGEICARRDLLVLSDEIHMDLAYSGHRHVPFASITPSLAERTITCVAPSKTFNVAGLTTSLVVASNPSLLSRYSAALTASGLGISNLFGVVGLEAAYRHGAEWLDQLLVYLAGNVEFADGFFRDRIPSLRFVRPEGTYLALIDCRGLQLAQAALDEFFLRTARVFFDSGPMFGDECVGFERINFGCRRAVLAEALERVERAVAELT
jgi:cystathionine beta-lyase